MLCCRAGEWHEGFGSVCSGCCESGTRYVVLQGGLVHELAFGAVCSNCCEYGTRSAVLRGGPLEPVGFGAVCGSCHEYGTQGVVLQGVPVALVGCRVVCGVLSRAFPHGGEAAALPYGAKWAATGSDSRSLVEWSCSFLLHGSGWHRMALAL